MFCCIFHQFGSLQICICFKIIILFWIPSLIYFFEFWSILYTQFNFIPDFSIISSSLDYSFPLWICEQSSFLDFIISLIISFLRPSSMGQKVAEIETTCVIVFVLLTCPCRSHQFCTSLIISLYAQSCCSEEMWIWPQNPSMCNLG